MDYSRLLLNSNTILSFIIPKREGGVKKHYNDSQPLNIVIPYSEYKELIEVLVSLNIDVLRYGLDIYRNALESKDVLVLYKLYLIDIGMSAIEEAECSTLSSKPCTRILGFLDIPLGIESVDVQIDSVGDFITNTIGVQNLQTIIPKFCKDIDVSTILSSNIKANTDMFLYGLGCLYYSTAKTVISLKILE